MVMVKKFLVMVEIFKERYTDYNFCGDGIVFADRTISPKAQEVKYLYQDIIIKPTDAGVIITNKMMFSNTSKYQFVYQLKQGKKVQVSEKPEKKNMRNMVPVLLQKKLGLFRIETLLSGPFFIDKKTNTNQHLERRKNKNPKERRSEELVKRRKMITDIWDSF